MHPHNILPVGLPPPVPMGAQQGGGDSSSGPDLLSSLKPCALPKDMPLPVSSRKAAAAAAAENNDDDDTGGFDWKGLARPSQKQRRQQPQRNASDAVAAASQRIAVITGTEGSHGGAAATAAAAAQQQHSSHAPEPERPGPQDGTDALGRRVWDKEYYEEKAKEKASLLGVDSFLDLLPKPREKPKPPPLPPCGYRQLLQRRTFKLDFEREVGRTKIVTLQTPRMQQGGFWCDICECLCKDSQAYLDHINGRNHNRLLGMSMRVERVPLAQVKAKLQAARQMLGVGGESLNPKTKAEAPVKQQPQQSQGGGSGALVGGAGAEGEAPEAEDEFERVKRRLEELQREQELKKQRKKAKKKAAAAGGGGTTKAATAGAAAGSGGLEANPDAAALAAMGLPTSFTGC